MTRYKEMKICISIAPSSMRQAVRQLRQAKTDLVEVRIDGIKDLNLQKLLRQSGKSVIITNRRKAEGGKFNGTWAQQFRILSEAIEHGADYIDVELHWGKTKITKLMHQRRIPARQMAGGRLWRKSPNPKTKLIVSYHNLKETPSNLLLIYNKIRSTGADVVKIVTTANDITDNKRIFDLTERANRDRQKIIALCMEERGQISRILPGKYGGFLSFAPISPEETTAPGQITYDELHNLYRADAINKNTKIVGLIGNPVVYSRGRYFHNNVFKRLKMNAVYVNFLVDDLDRFMSTFGYAYSGFSVTMPFKQQIVPHLNKLNGPASELGLVNTVVNRNNKLIGFNTDHPAIVSILQKRVSLKKKRVIVLGTGATSKTMAFAATTNGADVTIIGRSPEKAKILADELSCRHAGLVDLLTIESDIVMNGTPAGMQTDESLVPRTYWRRGMIAFDAVYSSDFTPLLQTAKAAGCKVISGTELFVEQAKLQSKLFLELVK